MNKLIAFIVGLTLVGTEVFLASAEQALEKVEKESPEDAPSIEQIIKKAEDAYTHIKDYTGRINKTERFDNELEKATLECKFAKPYKVYVKYVTSKKGMEALYVQGWNDNEVKAHKGSFPDITVNLDPYGGMAMDGNHHPITQFGLGEMIKVIAKNLRKAKSRGEGDIKVSDGGVLFGQPVWKIQVRYPKGGYFTTAKEDETLWDISKRTGQNMYLLLHANKEYDDPDDPDEGDKVFVPRYYGGKGEMFFSKKTFLPVKTSTWDWNGRLYESYEITEIKLNVNLTPKDFDPDNPQYDF